MLVRLATHAMGTRFELVLEGRDEPHARAVGEACVREIELWHTRLNAFSADSDVARINTGGPKRVDGELLDLLECCESIRVASDGLFDITCGGAMAREGFRGAGPAPAPDPPATRDASPPLLLDRAGMTVSLAPGRLLDLGGVAKGFALDRAGEVLREHGVEAALIHGGTSGVLAIGAPPGRDAWTVRVTGGQSGSGEGLELSLRNECLAVTAPRGRKSETGEKGHIIDPRTGRAVAIAGPGADTAAVTGRSALTCDAWAKPVLLLGARPAGLEQGYGVWVHAGGRWCNPGADRVQHGCSGDSLG
jgi:thiamine biosynthesis lipoprotein